MRILLSNDDGYQAEGLNTLALALSDLSDLVIVAPDRNQSGASHSLTLSTPLRVSQTRDGVHVVTGTPSDCVHLAITGLLDREPDMVIAGINHGANLGDDVLYSGTVAAAVEGRFLGLPAIAVSLVGNNVRHFDTAAQAARALLHRLQHAPLPSDTILNVNVPDVPLDELRGMQATRLGHRHRAEPMVPATDPKGNTVYWVGPAGPGQDAGPGTDFHAVEHGFVSVTPLQIDLTRHERVDSLAEWLPRDLEL
ncbi:MAG: 5'/3'-nucleotidase SurE [Gammaproteobacteria bacterium]|nr:5'/3'-nucleotidase SurE [Gammaproteobacteria bacterium]